MAITGQRKAGKHKNLPTSPDKNKAFVPASIAEDKDKLELWNFIVADLRNRGLYSPTYTFVITEMVETADRLSKSRAELDEEGDIIDRCNAAGDVIGTMANPRFAQTITLQASLIKLIEKVGMSPRDIVFLTQSETSDDEVITLDDGQAKVVYFR